MITLYTLTVIYKLLHTYRYLHTYTGNVRTYPVIIVLHVIQYSPGGDRLNQVRPQQPRIVPMGPHVTSARDHSTVVSTNVRRLEVLRNCVNFIFENKISDARKV